MQNVLLVFLDCVTPSVILFHPSLALYPDNAVVFNERLSSFYEELIRVVINLTYQDYGSVLV